jgi:hypothetical protein
VLPVIEEKRNIAEGTDRKKRCIAVRKKFPIEAFLKEKLLFALFKTSPSKYTRKPKARWCKSKETLSFPQKINLLSSLFDPLESQTTGRFYLRQYLSTAREPRAQMPGQESEMTRGA